MTAEVLKSMEPQAAAVQERIRRIVEAVPGHEGMKTILRSVAENPGKMIRSRLMLLAAGEHGEAYRDELTATAAALEMIHSASLILDDMIDDSPLRRGMPTVQMQYGKPIALCSGDYLLTTAFRSLTDSGFTASAAELMDARQRAGLLGRGPRKDGLCLPDRLPDGLPDHRAAGG